MKRKQTATLTQIFARQFPVVFGGQTSNHYLLVLEQKLAREKALGYACFCLAKSKYFTARTLHQLRIKERLPVFDAGWKSTE